MSPCPHKVYTSTNPEPHPEKKQIQQDVRHMYHKTRSGSPVRKAASISSCHIISRRIVITYTPYMYMHKCEMEELNGKASQKEEAGNEGGHDVRIV